MASALAALNSLGFIGVGALSVTTVFYSVALERIGLRAAQHAAATLVAVLAGAAVIMGVLLVVLLREVRFREEASRFGVHSMAGIAVAIVLVVVLGLLLRVR